MLSEQRGGSKAEPLTQRTLKQDLAPVNGW